MRQRGIVRGRSTITIEEAKYSVVAKDGAVEIRDYAPLILAEIVVDASLEKAGNIAFRRLFKYITGQNRARAQIAMTAPVSVECSTAQIAMTAPVSQQRTPKGFAVAFTMPASFTMDSIPSPNDPAISLRLVPARRMAAIRYSGFWSENRFRHHKAKLEQWLKAKGLTAIGEAVWARYNSPFALWFLRRNEVLLAIEMKPG